MNFQLYLKFKNMKDTFNYWNKINILDLNTIANLILTGHTAANSFPDTWLFDHIGDISVPLNVLDFGSGLGRNTYGIGLHSQLWNVIGYDNNSMISKADEFRKLHHRGNVFDNVFFKSNWDEIKTMKFDTIFCCIVLQHIHEEPLIKYINNFKSMTTKLIVIGRRFNDDPKKRSTWEILEENGLIPSHFYKNNSEIAYNKDGDANDHNLAIYNL